MKCPRCDGRGRGMAFVDRTDDCRSGVEFVVCSTCDGSGEVHDDYPQWVKRGHRLRRLRRTHGMDPALAAKYLGVSVTDLARMESGQIEPVEWRSSK